jgi:hypothetical protein
VLRALLTCLAVPLALGACHKPQNITVSDAWVRLSAVPRNPAAAYFTLHGGGKDATLVSVESEVAIRAELHESMSTGGMSSMKPIASVALPAGATVKFEPGGKHVMLFDMNPGITPGSRVPLLFTFADGERIEHIARGVGAADPVPKF